MAVEHRGEGGEWEEGRIATQSHTKTCSSPRFFSSAITALLQCLPWFVAGTRTRPSPPQPDTLS